MDRLHQVNQPLKQKKGFQFSTTLPNFIPRQSSHDPPAMKRVSTIFLLLLYASSFTEMHQLLRAPFLIAHFEEHQSQTEDLSFLAFISEHYLGDQHSDDRHDDLPFKHKHCEILHMVVAVVPVIAPSDFNSYSPWNLPRVSYEPKRHYQSATGSIWQPPRLQFS